MFPKPISMPPYGLSCFTLFYSTQGMSHRVNVDVCNFSTPLFGNITALLSDIKSSMQPEQHSPCTRSLVENPQWLFFLIFGEQFFCVIQFDLSIALIFYYAGQFD